jgi:F-type H+-transporting ATPase subunit b
MRRFALKIIGSKTILFNAALCACLAGAAVCLAAEGGEAAHHANSAAQLKDFGWRVLNFSIVFIILFWAAKKANVKGLLASRRDGVEKALREAAEMRDAAERKLKEYSEKLEKASREIDEIYAAIKKETEAEKNRILEEAAIAAGRIKEQAAASAKQEIEKARTELREEAARLSVQLAAQSLRERVEASDQDRFINEFINEYPKKVEMSH